MARWCGILSIHRRVMQQIHPTSDLLHEAAKPLVSIAAIEFRFYPVFRGKTCSVYNLSTGPKCDRWETVIGTIANFILWENEARHIATDCDTQFVGELFSNAHKDSIRYHHGREAILQFRPLPGQ